MMVRLGKSLVVVALLASLAACQSKPNEPLAGQVKIGKPYVIDGKTYYPEYDGDYDKVGEASWYGPGFHGKYTANGETFNQDDLTAAHPTLPMPSLVRVTNLDTGKSLIVRINDRGPFKSSRIIDLSKASAQKLNIKGTTQVRVQFLRDETAKYLTEASSGKKVDMFALNNEISTANDGGTAAGGGNYAPVAAVDATDITATTPATAQTSVTTTAQASMDNAPAAGAEPRSFQPPKRTKAQGQSQSQAALIKEVWAQDENGNNIPAQKTDAVVAKPVELSHDAPVKMASTKSTKTASHSAPAAKETADANMSPASGGASLMIQVGSFSTEQNAQKIKSKLDSIGTVAVDKVAVNDKTWYRVRLGPFSDQALAQDALTKVRSAGAPDARITRKL